MKICLSLDDFSAVNHRMDLLSKLKFIYPNFKVSLFTVPIDTPQDWGMYQIRKENLAMIKDNLDWIQIIPHGLYHNHGREMQINYEEFKKVIPRIEEAFNKDGLPFEKGFKAPHWRWTEGVVQVLDELGWWGAIDPRQKMPCPKKFYKFTHTLDNFPLNEEVLKLHGHIYGTKNDLGECSRSLLPYKFKEATWHYVTEFLQTK